MYKPAPYFLILLIFFAPLCHAERASIIVDVNTKKVLHAHNVNLPSYPASLTKLMTLYLVFEALDRHKLSLQDQLMVSKTAHRQIGSKLGLKKGNMITVKEVVLALIVRSANDAAMLAAETLAKTGKDFVNEMNRRARILGMKDTVFKNASGMPDPEQVTTARDLAVLAITIQKRFPHYFHFFSVKKFSYKNKTYKTHNHFAVNYSGAHGMKTGYTCHAGYNLITLVRGKKQQLIGVVLGEESKTKRDKLMERLMDIALQMKTGNRKGLTLNSLRYQKSQGANGKANRKVLAHTCQIRKVNRKSALVSSF